MSGQPKTKDPLASWTMIENIGAGGNADVWLARRNDGQEGAVKILRNLKEETYARFRNEIAALQKLGDMDGIIRCSRRISRKEKVPGPGTRCRLLSPLRHSIITPTPRRSSPNSCVSANAGKLHALKIAHRDIKPENLLGLNGRLCFSDFGLVKYPDLAPITPERRDVGAKFTMAPEMRREAAGADGLPADVFSFAKTLWIL